MNGFEYIDGNMTILERLKAQSKAQKEPEKSLPRRKTRNTAIGLPLGRRDGQFVKGDPRIQRGKSKEARDLRRALTLDGDQVHEALMDLVRQRSEPAVIYAHQQIIGKAKEMVEVTQGPVQSRIDYSKLTTEELTLLEALLSKGTRPATPELTAGDDAPMSGNVVDVELKEEPR